jgi:uncharacterized protein YdeI (YjbR/CyaY-like superfamily)
MTKKFISEGVIHEVPSDLRKVLYSNSEVLVLWEDITPLARNEWLCWIESAKKPETRAHRIQRLSQELVEGKRRPCCWPGCNHR